MFSVNEVQVTANLLSSPGFLSVFWSISVVLWSGCLQFLSGSSVFLIYFPDYFRLFLVFYLLLVSLLASYPIVFVLFLFCFCFLFFFCCFFFLVGGLLVFLDFWQSPAIYPIPNESQISSQVFGILLNVPADLISVMNNLNSFQVFLKIVQSVPSMIGITLIFYNFFKTLVKSRYFLSFSLSFILIR